MLFDFVRKIQIYWLNNKRRKKKGGKEKKKKKMTGWEIISGKTFGAD